MANDGQTLALFQTRVRQLLIGFKQLQKENEELRAMLNTHEQEIEELREKLGQKTRDYEALKAVKMMGISDGDIERTKAKLAKLIRDVNKCISILSEQK